MSHRARTANRRGAIFGCVAAKNAPTSAPSTTAANASTRLRAPYDILCKVIGNPTHRPATGERVAWDVDIDGARVRIADHKDDHPVGSNIFEAKHAIWHVEAREEDALAWACSRLAERVIEAVANASGARTLTADDKEALNALIKQGVPLAEAMKRVRMQVVDGDARALYQWPMKNIPLVTPLAIGEVLVPNAQGGEDEDEAHEHALSNPSSNQPRSSSSASSSKPKVPIGPPIPSDMPRSSYDAPYAKLVALLGEPEDKPIPFVSTRWRFVLDEKRPSDKQVVRHEDEPSDDPRDVDAAIFDRISKYDDPYGARTATTFSWTIISTSMENIDRVLVWLDERLED